jgi:hypothetical protein
MMPVQTKAIPACAIAAVLMLPLAAPAETVNPAPPATASGSVDERFDRGLAGPRFDQPAFA